MDLMLSLLGVAKLIFGIVVGVVGITVAAKVATRVGGFPSVDEGLRAGNVAVGIAVSGSIAAMGILVQHAVRGTFGAVDLLLYARGEQISIGWIFAYGAAHVALALGVGVAILVIGMRTFVRLTPDVDEIAEIRDGNVASALVLASVIIVIALLAQQGVETILNGLLPLPTLGRSGIVAPS